MGITAIPAGMQRLRVNQPMRIGTCEEAECSWYLRGHEGMDEGAPFSHPAGVRCGDAIRCTHPNCPCPQRQPHMVPDERFDLRFFGAVGMQPERQIVPDEWMQRTGEGAYVTKIIRERGL